MQSPHVKIRSPAWKVQPVMHRLKKRLGKYIEHKHFK